MKVLGFILVFTAGAATAGEGVGDATASDHESDALRGQPAATGYLQPSSPAATLEDRLDEIVRELDAALEQRLADSAAAWITEDSLLVSTD